MKAFVTGGTGFIGRHVVQRLVDRDYDVVCLLRRPEQAADMHTMGVTIVQGDVTDRESMRQGMTGADVVFHIAAWYEIGLPSSAEARMERINVGGTENVLALAVELGIPKIVYTSTVAVLGDTYSVVTDETHQRVSPLLSAYDRTKYQAHQVAERYIAQGAPVTIVMPAGVYGPGDHGIISAAVRLTLRRMLLVVPGADTGLSFVHVDDVAEGHVLAAEKGQIGESYILGGEIVTIGHAIQIIARLAGVPAPLRLFSSKWIAPVRPLVKRLEDLVAMPSLLNSETLYILGCTWWFTSSKAERELGYTHRSAEEGLAETVLWEARQIQEQPTVARAKVFLALSAVALAFGVIFMRGRRRKRARHTIGQT